MSSVLFYVYVLELEDNKFYVGKTNNPNVRLGEHVMNMKGSSWTSHYKPVRVLEIVKCHNDLDEDFTTIRYMKDKGIDNVRGGSFCELNLPNECIYTLEKIIKSSDDKCYYCNSKEHYIGQCPEKDKRRKRKKASKQKYVKKSDIPKNRILKYYGATKLMNNSNLFNKKNSYKCLYCHRSFDSYDKKKKHEDILCKKNYKMQELEKGIDDILDTYSKN
jgi:predicted GIY-YIG superfamily endonuclease